MGYDRGDGFSSDFESNGIPFGFQMEFGVQNRYHDHIPFNAEGNGNIVFSVEVKAVVHRK